MDKYQLVVFFLFVWFAIFWMSLVSFRMKLKNHIQGMIRASLLITPVSWLLIQLMQKSPYFHILNVPVEIGLGTFLVVKFLKFHRIDAFMMVTLSYGTAVALENVLSIISNEYELLKASQALAEGIHKNEWIWVLVMYGIIYFMRRARIGFTVVCKYAKPQTTFLFRLMLILTFATLWFSNIAVHFVEELLLLSTFLVFFFFGSISIYLYKKELSTDL
jgi:hypothetical protein